MTKCASTRSYQIDCHGQQCTHEAEVKCVGCDRDFCDQCVTVPMYNGQGVFDLDSQDWHCRDCRERKAK